MKVASTISAAPLYIKNVPLPCTGGDCFMCLTNHLREVIGYRASSEAAGPLLQYKYFTFLTRWEEVSLLFKVLYLLQG